MFNQDRKRCQKQYLCLCLCLWLVVLVWFIKNQTKPKPPLLVTLTNKQGCLSWFFFLRMKSLLVLSRLRSFVVNTFSTEFYTFGKIGDFDHASSLRKPR